MLDSPPLSASRCTNSRMFDEMSVASTEPFGPMRSAARSDCSPVPAAISSSRSPLLTRTMSSMTSVAGPSHLASVGVQSYHAWAVSCHCCSVDRLYDSASNLSGWLIQDPPTAIDLPDG